MPLIFFKTAVCNCYSAIDFLYGKKAVILVIKWAFSLKEQSLIRGGVRMRL